MFHQVIMDRSGHLSKVIIPGSPTPFLPTRNLCNNSTFAYVYRISNSPKYFSILIFDQEET